MDFYAQRALQLGADEVCRRGQAIYDSKLREQLDTPENLRKFLSIDIDSGDYAVGGRFDATRVLRARHPDAVVYFMKIGYPAAFTVAGRLRPLPR